MSSDLPRAFGDDYIPKKQQAQIIDGRVCAGQVDSLEPGRAKKIALKNYSIALFNCDGKFYAIKDACPHAEYPLSKGVLEKRTVKCASHSWIFDLTTGQCLKGDPSIIIRTFPIEIEKDQIWIRVE